MNITIIGAGPSGNMAAKCLAEAGFNVSVFEEHDVIGIPVQCTGIVTKVLFDLVPKSKEFLVNELDKVRVHGPSDSIDIPLREFVINRHQFDPFLAKQAESAGAKFFPGHEFLGKKGNKVFVRHKGKNKVITTDILIGADGPTSEVAKQAGLYGDRSFWVGVQAEVAKSFDPSVFEVFFGKLAPKFFAWSVPVSSAVSRVGLATQDKPKAHYDKFMEFFGGKTVSILGGVIPWFSLKQKTHDIDEKVYLVGDAAGLVKSTTGGGIITGMISGELVAESISSGTNYDKLLRPLKKELLIHNLIRRALDRFADTDYDELIRLMKKDSVKQILFDHPREYPSRFLFKLLSRQPWFLKFVPKMFL